MAYTQGLCSALQVNLNDIAGTNAPAWRREKTGMVDALMSDYNRAGFTAQVVPTDGKFKAVQINYQDQACDADVNTSCASNCTADVTPEPTALVSENNTGSRLIVGPEVKLKETLHKPPSCSVI